MKSSTYLTTIITLVFFGLAAVAIINYTIDPAGIYHENEFTDKLVSQLAESENGLLFQGSWNERDTVIALAKYSDDASCYVIGSSHINQIGSSRQQNSLTETCPKLVNLSVAGATLEDYIALSGAVLKNTSPPKTIVFGIDPWSLNFNRDSRWVRYQGEYELLLQKLCETNCGHHIEKVSLVKNLINLEYFIRSISNLNALEKTIANVPYFDQATGYSEPVRLPDGSSVYSKKTIQFRKSKVMTGLHQYKIVENVWYDESAVRLLVHLVTHLQQRFNVVFILTPYHPVVWEHQEQPSVRAMKIVENKVHKIAKSLDVKVFGSYDPNKVGCTSDDFIDEMHSSTECMMKLEK